MLTKLGAEAPDVSCLGAPTVGDRQATGMRCGGLCHAPVYRSLIRPDNRNVHVWYCVQNVIYWVRLGETHKSESFAGGPLPAVGDDNLQVERVEDLRSWFLPSLDNVGHIR